jgi:hypothetical protein
MVVMLMCTVRRPLLLLVLSVGCGCVSNKTHVVHVCACVTRSVCAMQLLLWLQVRVAQ